jgi:short-subunit dehydrogenase involved in D-alanine esterification of teichoic acids
MTSISLENNIVLVTGGGAGIGRAVSEAFGHLGAEVIIADTNREYLKETESHFGEKASLFMDRFRTLTARQSG